MKWPSSKMPPPPAPIKYFVISPPFHINYIKLEGEREREKRIKPIDRKPSTECTRSLQSRAFYGQFIPVRMKIVNENMFPLE